MLNLAELITKRIAGSTRILATGMEPRCGKAGRWERLPVIGPDDRVKACQSGVG